MGTTIFTTVVQTQVRPFTLTQTQVQTRTVNGPAVVQTREVVQTSVQQVPGRNQVITRDVVQTQQQQSIVTQTVNRAQQVTVTQTITATCAQAGYNYQQPSNPLTFG